MTNLIRVVTLCAAGAAMLAMPASACESGRCETGTQAAASKPLKLENYKRKPVATSATRTVKKKDGDYVKVAAKRRPKQRPAPLAAETLSPAAAQAFASYELARVRVVTPEEIRNVNLLADAAAALPNAATLVSVDNVQVVRADEINEIDRHADSRHAVSLDALSRDLAGSSEPKAEGESWLSRILMVFGGAFAAVAAVVRMLLG